MKMDHHCPFISNCVGHYNLGHYTALLAFAVLKCILASVTQGMSLHYGIYREIYEIVGDGTEPVVEFGSNMSLLFTAIGFGFSTGVIIAIGLLFGLQVMVIFRNQTRVEDWILYKAKERRKESGETFQHPYNLGIRKNLQEVVNWSCVPKGDGITWPVVEGADQFTLTREEVAQKEEERKKGQEYEIVIPYSGTWCPILQGFTPFMHSLSLGESRMRVEEGDRINVTREEQYWLYGNKIIKNKKSKEMEAKGWFPRRNAFETRTGEKKRN